MVTDHFSLPWSLFLPVHPGSHRQVLGLSGNCSVVGRVFVFMMLLWVIFCQICVGKGCRFRFPVPPSVRSLPPSRRKLQGSRGCFSCSCHYASPQIYKKKVASVPMQPERGNTIFTLLPFPSHSSHFHFLYLIFRRKCKG